MARAVAGAAAESGSWNLNTRGMFTMLHQLQACEAQYEASSTTIYGLGFTKTAVAQHPDIELS